MAQAQSKTAAIPAKQTLLVVDDRIENLEAMQALLEDGEWQLRCAKSGEEALRYLLEDDVGLVLLDVQMPGMDGFEVARLMRGNPRTRLTPIIFVSAIAQTHEAVLRGYSTGAVDFVLKPFDPSVLRHKIQSLLEHESNRMELQHLSLQLDRARAFNASVLANAAEGILVVGEDGRIQFANPAMAQMLGGEVGDLEGVDLLSFLKNPACEGGWQQSEFYLHFKREATYRVHEAMMRTLDGGCLPVALSCSPLPRLQRAMVVIALDMSVVRNLHAQLESQAVTDSLTGLLNRRGFHQALESSLARIERSGQRLAVLYLDLDGFKRINDSLGHDVGDQLLRRVGEQLKACLRPYDSLARIGGDEFTALLDNLGHPEDAARVAEKLIELVSVRHTLDGVDVTLGASVGIACFPECGQNVEGLLRSADMAMYEAKRAGRQQYRFFSPEMNGRARSRLMLEESLRHAIENDDFVLVYQPQFELASGRLRGFEALLRWQHRVAGTVAPNVFIPLLEETRLINRLGEWIFREGARQLAIFKRQFGEDMVLSLNVSPVQFGMPQLVTDLQRVLDSHGLKPSQLEVEVTESALMQDLELTQAQLRHLRELGVKIAIDDFGTGYSSLAYLRHFELDTLKIDRLFIANMLDSPRDAAVVSTIIDLGRHLGLEVIAEGVETQAQREWLVQHHCNFMQGFLVAPGVPAGTALRVPAQLDWSTLPLPRED
ncbi:Phytochrome-like protein cph2 [Pseudomonas sp. THAF187a]|uniref:putative bifunctional diguanylate cyclase/phosphodiesterase n=1 Tax=Pseudomonadaceae TaxID=135621 RepID=UPI000646EDA8|nr:MULTISPECIES: EAL domain-containing protein [unclassified Pseudomonas]QFT23729.1 Phytochrome-like protein cph2 [Pseudomonas sp. THAF187a]QFT43917.1 Phytochrome-like protein cph2 [Pseudomonas sp. THAF42]TNF09561.1 MAG: EAL domain-containing protein [Pseudomonadales bacterium]WFC63910.1 EAL domain-containing protein [Pseudomonas sp. REST10]|tara:strand:- start:8197 stop:10344 length:2148 start_codon:yes stop_codon:yes gene_type:complete